MHITIVQFNVCISLDNPIVFVIPSYPMKSFTVCMWNVQGLNSSAFGLKSLDPQFKSNLTDIDIVILQESWCKADTVTHCPINYRELIVPSQKHSNVTRGRESGGLIIWYKSDLHNQISPIKMGKYYNMVKAKERDHINRQRPVYLCNIHSPL